MDQIRNVSQQIYNNPYIFNTLIVIIVISAIFFYNNYIRSLKKHIYILKGIHDAKLPLSSENELPVSTKGNSYTVSFWININDWDYQYMKNKMVLTLPQIAFTLDGEKNVIKIIVPTVDSDKYKIIKIDNVPLQTWINFTVTSKDRLVNVYMNSKLVNSTTLTSLPSVVDKGIYVTPYGGFDGQISDILYITYDAETEEISKIFNDGYNSSSIFKKLSGKALFEVGIPTSDSTKSNEITLDKCKNMTDYTSSKWKTI